MYVLTIEVENISIWIVNNTLIFLEDGFLRRRLVSSTLLRFFLANENHLDDSRAFFETWVSMFDYSSTKTGSTFCVLLHAEACLCRYPGFRHDFFQNWSRQEIDGNFRNSLNPLSLTFTKSTVS